MTTKLKEKSKETTVDTREIVSKLDKVRQKQIFMQVSLGDMMETGQAYSDEVVSGCCQILGDIARDIAGVMKQVQTLSD